MKNAVGVLSVLILSGFALPADAQTPAPAANRLTGTVTSIDTAAKLIKIKTDTGEEVAVTLQDRTNYLKADADLKNTAKIALSDVSVGDRMMARGAQSEDKKAITATLVVVVTKADVAKKQEAQMEEWQKRGVTGTITSVNADTKDIIISVRTREGIRPLIIPASGKVDIKRYAPDSNRLADAKPATFADLRVGDELHALGTKSEDGTHLTPEFIVAGTFRMIAATVLSVDAAGKTIRVTDLDTKKPTLVRVEGDTTLKKLPPETATMLAARLKNVTAAGSGGGGPRPEGGGAGGARPVGGPGGPGGRGGGAANIEQILERSPAIGLADLKAGDALIISSTAGSEPDKVTAIKLLAGVEPILTSAPKGRQGMVLGNWNLGGGGAEQ